MNNEVFLFIEETDYVYPVWPEETGKQQKQMHFDFQVDKEIYELCHSYGAVFY